jgi:hypothetical protein
MLVNLQGRMSEIRKPKGFEGKDRVTKPAT